MVELEKLAFIRSLSRHVGVDADALIHRLPPGSCGMVQETEEGMEIPTRRRSVEGAWLLRHGIGEGGSGDPMRWRGRMA